MLLTNRLELLFLTVLAFPKASRRGLDCRMMSFTCCVERNRKQRGFESYIDIWHSVEDNKYSTYADLELIGWGNIQFVGWIQVKLAISMSKSGLNGLNPPRPHIDINTCAHSTQHLHSICTALSSLSHSTQQPRDRQTDAEVLGYPKTIIVYNIRLLETEVPCLSPYQAYSI